MAVIERFKAGFRNQVRKLDSLFPEQNNDRAPSIFDYYSVANEIEFARNAQLPAEDANFYIEDNVRRFLGEFAGQVPYTNLAYKMKDGAFSYRGVDLTPSYERTAQNSDRELDEYIGYSRIQKAFAQGASSAIWISPPKTADYGFVFYFSRDEENPDQIREHVLRYSERQGDLSTSKNMLKKVYGKNEDSLGYITDRDFLRKPVIGTGDVHTTEDLQIIMSAVGINKEKVDESLRFEKRVQKELTSWISLYSSAVLSGDIDSAEKLLLAIYNRAYDTHSNTLQFPNSPVEENLTEANFNYYASQMRTVTAGSCPVTQNVFNDPFGPTNILEKLLSGKSINGLVSEAQHFICPECDFHATGPVGNVCPGCKLTKEDYVKEAAKNGVEIC